MRPAVRLRFASDLSSNVPRQSQWPVCDGCTRRDEAPRPDMINAWPRVIRPRRWAYEAQHRVASHQSVTSCVPSGPVPHGSSRVLHSATTRPFHRTSTTKPRQACAASIHPDRHQLHERTPTSSTSRPRTPPVQRSSHRQRWRGQSISRRTDRRWRRAARPGARCRGDERRRSARSRHLASGRRSERQR